MKLNFPYKTFNKYPIKNCYDRPQDSYFFKSKPRSSIVHNNDESSQGEAKQMLMVNIIIINDTEHVYMKPGVNSNRFEISDRLGMPLRLHGNFSAPNLEISNRFQKLFRLHDDFTVTTFQTIVRHFYTCTKDSLN